MYSQNNEERYILDYFKDFKGIFLDIGAYDGIDLSNTRALVESGWLGICFEPNPNVFERLADNQMAYKGVYCYEMALGATNGTFEMQMNDSYYSTLKESELQRWANTDLKFKTELVEVIDFETFMENSPYKTFDFISIDCEGIEIDILKQMDLNKLQTKMICVEWNGKNFDFFDTYMTSFGMKLISSNPENLIYIK